MKKQFFYTKLFVFFIALIVVLPTSAQDYYPREFDDVIQSPYIKDNKVRNTIVNYQERRANELAGDYNVNLIRNNEVLVFTFPADLFFEANATELSKKADETLDKIAQFLRVPGFYHAVLAMYHGNTGSKSYCKAITDKRIESITNWFEINNYNAIKYISSFSFGLEHNILPNDSMNNRRMNRRLEVYLVPDNAMFENAKRHLLK